MLLWTGPHRGRSRQTQGMAGISLSQGRSSSAPGMTEDTWNHLSTERRCMCLRAPFSHMGRKLGQLLGATVLMLGQGVSRG